LSSEDLVSGRTFFDRFTGQTAGFTLKQQSLEQGISQLVSDSHLYYLLGFQPDKKRTGKHMRIEIETSRKNIDSRFRKGYTYLEVENFEDKTLRSVLQFPAYYQDFPVELSVDRASGEMRAEVRIPSRSLEFEEKGGRFNCKLGLYGVLLDSAGKWITEGKKFTFARSFDLKLDQQRLRALLQNRTVGASATFNAAPGEYELIVAIQQLPSGYFASERIPVTVD
jgi:hypothetical protein